MSQKPPNLVMETSTTTGTGNYTLAGAVTGYQSFSGGGLTNGDTVHYTAIGVDANGNPNGDGFEVGLGTWNTGGTLTRTTILSSSNSGSAVSWSAGTRRIFATMPAQKGALPDIQIFTASGTWTKPTGLVAGMTYVGIVGGGGGGGAGRRGASSSLRAGGKGGQGGGVSFAVFPIASLGSTETVTVGTGGAGGAAQTADSTSGADGADGGTTTFGSKLTASGGVKGNGGTTAFQNITAATSTFYSTFPGGEGGWSGNGVGGDGNPPAGTSQTKIYGAGGGGGGGDVTAANADQAGGAGGLRSRWVDGSGGGSAGTATGGTGGAGGSVPTNTALGGGGGGGGGGRGTGGTGGSGGAAGSYGGGGGGGGGSTNGNNSGAGAAGADGICVVISW